MAKPLHSTADIPTYDSYPSGPQLADTPDRLLPEKTESSPLESAGAQMGYAAGRAVAGVRRAQQKVRDIAGRKGANVTDIASARVHQAAEEASVRAEQLGRSVRDHAAELQRRTRNAIYRARLRMREAQNEYPLQVVAVAGLIGLSIGVGLRIWRSTRA